MWKVSPKIPKPYTHQPIYFELSIGSSFAVYQIDDNVVFFKYVILILELRSFFDRGSDKKIEITKKLVHLHIKLGEVVEVHILCEFFSLQIILYSWLWNLSLSKYLFSPLQGVDLYIKLLSEVSDDSIKCSLQTELLSLLSRLPSLTQDQEQLVSNISCLNFIFVNYLKKKSC